MNKRVPNDSCKSAFKFLVRNGCVKGRKIKGLDACDMVERGSSGINAFSPTCVLRPGSDNSISL